MLPWLQRRWRTGQLGSKDGGEQMCFKSTPRYFRSSASFYQVDLGRLLSHSLSSSSPAVLAASCSHLGWLGSRVVSVLDSGAEGPGFKSQPRPLSGNSLGQTVHTHRASVHKAAKLVAALLRVARVTAGLKECNGSLPPPGL